MTDALWNGFIGAGGAAICCAVYFSFKAARKGISKVKFVKQKSIPQETTNALDSSSIESETVTPRKQLTITVPSVNQIFTRGNLRAFGFILLSIVCIIALDDVGRYRGPMYDGYALSFEGDFYSNVSANLNDIAKNTKYTYNLIHDAIEYLFGILAGVFAILGLTSIKFK